jgi:N-acetylmuramoyl-L-alanine amidase
VTAYRYGLFDAGKSRIVLDSSEPVLIENSFVLRPQNGQPARLVVDLVRTDRDTYFRIHDLVDRAQDRAAPDRSAEAPPAPEPEPQPDAQPEPEQEPVAEEPAYLADTPVPLDNPLRTGAIDRARIEAERAVLREDAEGPVRHVVVIDPGHGGVDPGAIGRGGTTEKRVVFDLSLVLRDLLSETGRYEVHLTRDEDTFVSLRDRVDFARRHAADLFIAVHADSLRRRSVRGGTVYTLSERASDREAEELARRENRADLISGVNLGVESDEVTGILLDLAQRETNNLSVRFARTVVASLDGVTHLTRNPHRVAGFRVLKAPDVPSVLLEIGYISNSDDETLLASQAWRKKVAKALVAAIDAYFQAQR